MKHPCELSSRCTDSCCHAGPSCYDSGVRRIFPVLLVWAVTTAQASIPYLEIARYQGDREAAVSLTFDDGFPNQILIAIPLFNEFGIRATFFLHTQPIDEAPDDSPLGWANWRRAAAAGHEIASHTIEHLSLPDITDAAIRRSEIVGSADIIERQIGERPMAFAYPFSAETPTIKREVAETYVLDRGHCRIWGGRRFTAARGIRQLERAREQGEWFYCMLHGIDENTFEPITSDDLREIAVWLADNRDTLWVDTYSNVGRYLRQRGVARVVTREEPGGFAFRIHIPDDIPHRDRLTVPLTVLLPLEDRSLDAISVTVAGEALSVYASPCEGFGLVDVAPAMDWVSVRW